MAMTLANNDAIAKIYVKAIERGDRTIQSVPSNIREKVRALVLADGYEFDEAGYAHLPTV